MRYLVVLFALIFLLANLLPMQVQAEQLWRCTCPNGISCGTYDSETTCENQAANQCGGQQGACAPFNTSDNNDDSNFSGLQDPLDDRELPQIIGGGIKVGLGVVGAIALALFVYGGFMWMTAAGNTTRVQKGREVLVWATIGLIVIFTSYALLNFVLGAITGSG